MLEITGLSPLPHNKLSARPPVHPSAQLFVSILKAVKSKSLNVNCVDACTALTASLSSICFLSRLKPRLTTYTLKRVSEPSASISVTVRLLIHTSLAKRIGFRRDTSGMGAVE